MDSERLRNGWAWARQVEREYDRHGLSLDLKSLRSITVADLIVRYRDSVVTKKRSCEVETVILNACLRQEWANTPVGQVTPLTEHITTRQRALQFSAARK